MDNWFRLYDKEPKALDNNELRRELEAQRFFMRSLEQFLFKAKGKFKQMEKSLEEYLKQESYNRGGAKTKENAVVAWSENIRFLDRIHDTAQAWISLLEDEYAYRLRFNRINKRSLREKKRKEIYHEVNKARKVNRSESVDKVWNREALNSIAHDRGYKINETFLNDVAKLWGVAIPTAKKILDSGKLTWGQVLLLGHMLEMTPREFAETFMRGYFEEVSEGQFRAWGKADELVYSPPPQHEYVPPETIIFVDESGESIAEGEYFEVNWDN